MAITFRTALVAAVLPIAGAAWAADQIVPIEQEPQHRLKFQNRHVRFFDVLLPPGYVGIYHTHVYDGVFVNIETAATRAQDLGADPQDRPPRNVGDVYFIDFGTKPKVHRVANIGGSTYRVTDTEVLHNCDGFAPVKESGGESLILENDRVRVTRLKIDPGETIALHPPCGMLVAVSWGQAEVPRPWRRGVGDS